MRVLVDRVAIAENSSIGIAEGATDDGTVRVLFAGGWRAMRDLGEAMQAAGEPVPVEVEDWQVLGIHEVDPEG